MRGKVFGTTVLGLLVMTTGCSIVGKWTVTDVEPTAAQRDIEFHSLRLDKDGSFYAEAKEGESIKTTSGTYTHKNSVLTLTAHDGERHTYDAELSGDTLHLESFWEGKKLEVDYKRKTE
ncbi:MAG TPA: lipocalin family protein [Phycisphaerae bacterium]|nr:lipocalin family protein [Phycisphaerae bacterium]